MAGGEQRPCEAAGVDAVRFGGSFEYAFERNVVIATPTTLLALLRTVAYSWRQERLAQDAGAVLEVGRTVHTRLSTLSGHLTRLGSALGSPFPPAVYIGHPGWKDAGGRASRHQHPQGQQKSYFRR